MKNQTTDRWHERPLFRFVVAGGLNTAGTAALVILLSLVIAGWLAFSISFAIGIVFSVVVTGRWVFRTHVSAGRALTFTGAYFTIYLCGLLVIQLLENIGAPPAANGASVLATAPLSFLAARFIFGNNGKVNQR